MRNTRKILVALLVLMTLLMSMTTIFASAASTDVTVYLTPNGNWKADNARFAVYTWGGPAGEKWINMTDSNKDGVYEATLPAGYSNLIFCRMNPGASANNWNNKWNQTADLTLPTSGANHYTVNEGTWDKGGGNWSTFGSTCNHVLGDAATCTTAQICTICKDPIVSALGHNYNSSNVCGRCGSQATFTVAGSGAHLGSEWDTNNTANDMTYSNGVYTKVYTDVAAGSYALKCVRDHDWGTSYGDPNSGDKDGNYLYTVATAGSTVTVTLNGEKVEVKIESHTHSWSDATCTEAQKCECGETQGEALGHTEAVDAAVAPTCTATGLTEGKHCSVCNEVLVAQSEVAALGHSHSATVTAPTCTAAGYTTYTCSCGDSYTGDEVAALGHTEAVDAAVAPTCTATGLTEGKHCSVCNEVLVAQSEVAALGHSYETGICSVCGAEDPLYVDPDDGLHLDLWVSSSDYTVNGLNIKYNGAGNSYSCAGADVAELAVGNNVFTVTITNNGSADSRVRFDIQGTTKPDGAKHFVYNTGATGGDVWTDMEWGGSTVTVPAGQSVTLVVNYECTGEFGPVKNVIIFVDAARGDDATYSADITLSAMAFRHVCNYKVTETVDPTCEAAGSKTYTCSCGASYPEEIAALGHSYTEGVCSVCGAADPNYVPPHVNTLVVGDTNKIVIDSDLDNGYGYYIELVPFVASEAGYYAFVGEGLTIWLYDSNNALVSMTGAANLDAGMYFVFVAANTPATTGEYNVAVSQSAWVNTLAVGDNTLLITDALANDYGYYIVWAPFVVTEKANYTIGGEGILALVYDSTYQAVATTELEAGTYYVCVAFLTPATTGFAKVTVEKTAIGDVEVPEIPALDLGDNTVVIDGTTTNLTGNAVAWYTFTPETSGAYQFACSDLTIYILTSQNMSDLGAYVGAGGIAELEAGTLYYVLVGKEGITGEFTVNVATYEGEKPHVNTIVLGDNHYIVSDALIAAEYEWLNIEITEPGTYVIKGGAPMTVFFFTVPGTLDTSSPFGWNIDNTTVAYVEEFYVTLAEAGTYWMGFRYDNIGDLREFDFNVSLHEHKFADGLCSDCGAADPNYVPPHEHNFVEGKCECGESDPNYVPEQPVPEQPAPELSFIEKIMMAITQFFAQIGDWFKNLLAGFKK